MSLQGKIQDQIIPAHEFITALRLHAYRAFDVTNGATRAEVDTVLGLDAGESAQMDEIIAYYNSLTGNSNIVEKLVYLQVIEDTAIALQNGWITPARAAGLLQITA